MYLTFIEIIHTKKGKEKEKKRNKLHAICLKHLYNNNNKIVFFLKNVNDVNSNKKS